MNDDDCIERRIFSENDLFWGLDPQIETVFEVGCGNVLYVSGWCFHKIHPITRLKIILDNLSYQVSHINIFRPDITKKLFPNDSIKYKDFEQCGFWCMIPIKKSTKPITTRLILEITLKNEYVKNVLLSDIILLPRKLHCNELDEKRELVKKMISKIKNLHSGQHILICLAAYDPNRDLFKNQINSIKGQTYKNWSCLINDDCSKDASYNWMKELVENDNRFIILKNEKNIGFYKNFERLLCLVPDNADFVALSDQDDYWHSDKIEQLIGYFEDETTLVYSDMNIVDINGNIISDTFWTTRKNYYKELDYLVLVNTITGASSMFRSSIIKYLLPFPINIGTSYHDHWIGCIANALGEIRYIERPLYDYYQHGNNILGQATFSKRGVRARIEFLKHITDISYIRDTLLFYHRIFNTDGIRLILIVSTMIERIPQMDRIKRKKLNKFYNLPRSSQGLLTMIIETILNGKTTSSAEWIIYESYWADKIIRSRVLKTFVPD